MDKTSLNTTSVSESAFAQPVTAQPCPERAAFSDSRYLDDYFVICGLLQKKRQLLAKLHGKRYSATLERNPQKIRQAIRALERRIIAADQRFWDELAGLPDKGAGLAWERLCAHYQLNLPQKRALLFLLFLGQVYPQENRVSGVELAAVLDTSGDPVAHLRLARQLFHNSNLVAKGLITRVTIDSSDRFSEEFYLKSKVLNELAILLDGGSLDSAGHNRNAPRDAYGDIGFIKTPEHKLSGIALPETVKEKLIFFLEDYIAQEVSGQKDNDQPRRGISFLFYGPPGTGKSLTAEAIAAYLGRSLLVVEFPKITSRWFGDTDKNISQMFKTAANNDTVLCLDEADSLLYNRSYAGQEHDIRFVNVMLQEVERFKGVIILTTNMDVLLDPALERRISLRIKFENPDEDLRREIWRLSIPPAIEIARDIDFDRLARQYDFSGGYIKNAVDNALRRMRQAKRQVLEMADLSFGADMEKEGLFRKETCRKIGFAAR